MYNHAKVMYIRASKVIVKLHHSLTSHYLKRIICGNFCEITL